jgi:CheY-like chemotaxis protein
MKTILAVDDNHHILEVISMMLEPEGLNIIRKTSGVEALDVLRTQEVDLLMTDLMMPEMNGFELIREAKKVRPAIKIVVISAGVNTAKLMHEEDELTGVAGILEKPFDADQLLQLVSSN